MTAGGMPSGSDLRPEDEDDEFESMDGEGNDGEKDPVFDRPVFIISPPRAGSSLLFETLSKAPGLFSIGGESHALIESIPQLQIDRHGFDSNRLLADDASSDVVALVRGRFRARARDRDGAAPGPCFRLLEKTPKNALRIPFLLKVFPQAQFVYLHREPREVMASMIEAWQSGRFVTYPDLPGWPSRAWSLALTPGWRQLIGRPLAEIVAGQWHGAMSVMLDDLAALPRHRWHALRYADLRADPPHAIASLCINLGLEWDKPLARVLPLSRHTLTPPQPDKWRRHAAAIEPLLPPLQATIERAARMAATV